MGTVRLYATLRAIAGGVPAIDVDWRAGATVGDVIRELLAVQPALEGRIVDERGCMVPYVAVFVDGRDVRHLAGLATTLSPSDEIAIFPPVAGG